MIHNLAVYEFIAQGIAKLSAVVGRFCAETTTIGSDEGVAA